MNVSSTIRRLSACLAGAACVFALSSTARAAVDLVVEDVSYDQQSSSITVKYKNIGDTNSAVLPFLSITAGSRTNVKQVPSPQPGQSNSITLTTSEMLLSLGKTYNFWIYIDYYSSVAESNENNNWLSKDIPLITGTAPDLVIDDYYYDTASASMKISYRNGGLAAPPGSTHTLLTWINGVVNSVSLPVPGAAQSSVYSVAKGNLGLVEGNNTVAVYVDYNNIISEMNESNNNLSKSIWIEPTAPPAQPDFIISGISYSDSTGLVSVSCKNSGTANTSSGIYVSLTGNGYTSYQYVTAPAYGQSINVNFSKSVFGLLSGGSYTMNATADYGNYVVESNETNNSLSKLIMIGASSGGGSTNTGVVAGGVPDLTVTDVLVSAGTVQVKFKNIGTGNGYGYTFYVRMAGDNGRTYTVGPISLDGRNLNTVYTASANMNYLQMYIGTSMNVTGTVDYGNYVYESNEGNNSMTKLVTGTLNL